MLEHYWEEDEEEDEEEAKRRFLALAQADHPVAMAIVNELTDEELDATFRWPRSANGDARDPLPATPVVAVLTEEQYERARVTAVAENEDHRARTRAAEDADLPSGESLPANERMRTAEERFVAAMAQEIDTRRGEETGAASKGTVEERIAAMREPWRSRTMREFGRLAISSQGVMNGCGEGPSARSTPPNCARSCDVRGWYDHRRSKIFDEAASR